MKFSIVFILLDYGLYVMHLSHLNAHDLVFDLVLWIFSLFSSNCSTKTIENPILLYCDYWDCVGLFSCSLGTISGTNIFGAIAREGIWKPIFPGTLIISLVWEVNLNQQILKTTVHQCFTMATKGVGTRSRPSSPLQMGVSDPRADSKNS